MSDRLKLKSKLLGEKLSCNNCKFASTCRLHNICRTAKECGGGVKVFNI